MAEADFDIVVIGAGPAGLSAAIEAADHGRSTVLLEAQDTPGGLTRSFERDGYTFDCSGHLLHLSDPEAVALVERAVPDDAWNRVSRNSVIFLDGSIIPYPFQTHLAHAPETVRRECLEGLPDGPPPEEFASFGEWIQATLGSGIANQFMIPYNEKLSTVSVDELTCEWLGRFVPQPSLDDIRAGAATKRTVATGYNRSFLYPARGGIATLSRSLAAMVPNLVTGAKVAEIDTAQRLVRTADGRSFGYESAVIATAPLPRLASLVNPGAAVLERAATLRANTVTCVNVGLKSANPAFSRYQWIYLPERRFAAYRVGFYARFASTMAPPERESVYVEIAHGPDDHEERLVEAALDDLRALGAIEGEADVDTVLPVRIDCAYVIHDHGMSAVRTAIHEELLARDVHVAGRYATWEYSAMEDAIVDGLRTARQIVG